jgi:tRNA(Ile)-lysidine synthase
VRQRRYLPDPTETVLRNYSASDLFLVGVSGGRDSVGLLDWLVAAGYRNLVVCHLNHQLRGRAAAADANFVKKFAAKLGAQVVVNKTDVRQLAAKERTSLEATARRARYRFFAKSAERYRSNRLILAHHADDLVETFLINLFRGSGRTGLGSIRDIARHDVGSTQLHVLRPFLSVWRKDIDHYVRQRCITFREDASNVDLEPLRNRIRHRVLPYLEKSLGRQLRQNIWRTAMILAEEENFFSDLLPDGNSTAALMVRPLRDMAVALQRRALHKWLRDSQIADVGFDVVERVRKLLDTTKPTSRTNLPRDRYVRRRAGKLFLE